MRKKIRSIYFGYERKHSRISIWFGIVRRIHYQIDIEEDKGGER